MTLERQFIRPQQVVQPTREAGLGALDAWLGHVPDYARQRNFDFEGHLNVSRLSPFLAGRLMLEDELVRATLNVHPYSVAERFLEQVGWRSYWQGWLAWHPEVWRNYQNALEQLGKSASSEERADYETAVNGQTGIEAFDAWVAELTTTGYLHNHARMWFASIWIFTLKLPWEWGADFFLRHLLDGDIACNTLSWRWVAGLHTSGKHYIARASNIARFTEGRFNPIGLLNESPLPLEDESPLIEAALPWATKNSRTDLPALSDSPAGLLILTQDLTPEQSELSEAPFQSVAAMSVCGGFPGMVQSERVTAFKAGAIRDAATRVAEHWDGELVDISALPTEHAGGPRTPKVSQNSPMRVYLGEVDDFEKAVLQWARREHLRTIRVLEPGVGPWRDSLDRLRGALQRNGVKLLIYRRAWDETHWPAATHGYFKFRKEWKARLESLLGESF
jgi:deoxyribodipyrimidine photo-lyase